MSQQSRVLRIRVTKQETEEKVNITLPLGLARLARMGGIAETIKQRHAVDIDKILDGIEETPDGKIVDVVDDKTGDHVEIFVETRGASHDAADATAAEARR